MDNITTIQATQSCWVPPQIFSSKTPIVIKGLVSDWPIVQSGSQSNEQALACILKYYQGLAVTAFILAAKYKGRMFYNNQLTGFNFAVIKESIQKLMQQTLDKMRTSSNVSTCYIGSTNIDHWLPNFNSDHRLQFSDVQPLASIWLGNQSVVAAHFDFPNNIACNVVGRRRFTLFPPDQIDNLYIGPLDLTPAGQPISLVDMRNPDYQKHPKFKLAMQNALTVELEPGDAIYIPSMWWHQVEALADFNVLVNYWWRDSEEYLGSPFDALLHSILSLKNLPTTQRKIWQNMMNYYVFNDDPQKPKVFASLKNNERLQQNQALRLRKMLIRQLQKGL